MQKFGIIKFFVYNHDSVFALTQELVKDFRNRWQVRIHPQLNLDPQKVWIPVRLTYSYSLVNINQIEKKLLVVKDHVCLPPNYYEKKL